MNLLYPYCANQVLRPLGTYGLGMERDDFDERHEFSHRDTAVNQSIVVGDDSRV